MGTAPSEHAEITCKYGCWSSGINLAQSAGRPVTNSRIVPAHRARRFRVGHGQASSQCIVVSYACVRRNQDNVHSHCLRIKRFVSSTAQPQRYFKLSREFTARFEEGYFFNDGLYLWTDRFSPPSKMMAANHDMQYPSRSEVQHPQVIRRNKQ